MCSEGDSEFDEDNGAGGLDDEQLLEMATFQEHLDKHSVDFDEDADESSH